MSHIGYDTVVNGKDPTLSLFSFAFEKGAGLAVQRVKSNLSPSKINDLELEYNNYVAKKLDSGSEPLSMSEWLERRNISKQNFSTYEAFQVIELKNLN